jgi:hypothetical protein
VLSVVFRFQSTNQFSTSDNSTKEIKETHFPSIFARHAASALGLGLCGGMLFKLQIVSLSLEPGIPFKTKDERPRNIFLDLWSQGQPKRYFYLIPLIALMWHPSSFHECQVTNLCGYLLYK